MFSLGMSRCLSHANMDSSAGRGEYAAAEASYDRERSFIL